MKININIEALEDDLCDLKIIISSMKYARSSSGLNQKMKQILINASRLSQVMSAIIILKDLENKSKRLRVQ
jgi:hypothetical protein